MRRPSGPRAGVTAIAVLLTLALSVSLALIVVRHRIPPGPGGIAKAPVRARVVPPPLADPRIAGINAVLASRASAVLHRDRRAFMATVDPAVPAFRRSQQRLFTALSAVRFASWSYDVDLTGHRPAPDAGRFTGAPTYAPSVVFLRYRLAGFDSVPTATAQHLTFVRRVGGWRVGSDSDFERSGGRTERELWDFGAVVTVYGHRSLVLGHPDRLPLLRRLAAEADRDVPRVTKVWGTDWPQRVVVIVPDSQRELAAILNRPPSTLTRIAAVATAELLTAGGASPAVGNRVLINPANLPGLGALGMQVVMTHEITHVATRAFTAAAAPTWLVEGFADYVAYRSTTIGVDAAARELRAEVQAGRVPVMLPTDAEFGGGNDRLPQVYEEAWLAVRLIAARGGVAALLRFYRAVAGPVPTDTAGSYAIALQDAVHLTPDAFTAAWRTYLRTELA